MPVMRCHSARFPADGALDLSAVAHAQQRRTVSIS